MVREILHQLAATQFDKIIRRLEKDVFPWLGSRPVGELQPLTCSGRYVFPSLRKPARPILLNEQGWNRDAIERQLAHGEREEVRAAYNYAQHLPERRKMMQSCANFLDGLRVGSNVVPLKMYSRLLSVASEHRHALER